MTLTETALVLLIACGMAGLVVVLAVPVAAVPEESGPENVSGLEALELMCGDLIYGSVPRRSVSADTTILTMDLDVERYTPAQANLFLTGALRRTGIRHITTLERPDGGLSFVATLENGDPLRLELKY